MHKTFLFECADSKYSNIFFDLFPKHLNKAFLVLNFKFFTQHETFIFKEFEGTVLNLTLIHIQATTFKTRCVGKVTLSHKFKVTDIESVNNILKLLRSNTYFKYVLSPSISSVRFRSSRQRCSMKKLFLEISQNSQGNTCIRVSFLTKMQS